MKTVAELENDFVPWLLRRVDNTLQHCIASSCLDDGEFLSSQPIFDFTFLTIYHSLAYADAFFEICYRGNEHLEEARSNLLHMCFPVFSTPK